MWLRAAVVILSLGTFALLIPSLMGKTLPGLASPAQEGMMAFALLVPQEAFEALRRSLLVARSSSSRPSKPRSPPWPLLNWLCVPAFRQGF